MPRFHGIGETWASWLSEVRIESHVKTSRRQVFGYGGNLASWRVDGVGAARRAGSWRKGLPAGSLRVGSFAFAQDDRARSGSEPLHSLRMTGALSVGRADTGSAPMGCDVYDKRHGEVIEHPVVCGPRGLAARVQDLPYKVPVQRFNSGVVTARTVCRQRGIARCIASRWVLRIRSG